MWYHSETEVTWEVWIEPPGNFTPYRFMDHQWGDYRTALTVLTCLSPDVRECASLVKVTRERVNVLG